MTRILVLAPDPAAAEQIGDALAAGAYELTVVRGLRAAVSTARRHSLVVIDAEPGLGVQACRELRGLARRLASEASPPTQDEPAPVAGAEGSLAILAISQSEDIDQRIALLEAGADDVLARPFDGRELAARVEAVLVTAAQGGQPAEGTSEPGSSKSGRGRRLIVCLSPKGGVGTTTIAVNVAAFANELHPGRVLFIDLDAPFGQAAVHLNLRDIRTVSDVLSDEEALSHPDSLRGNVTRHETGLSVLAAAPNPQPVGGASGSLIERLLTTAHEAYDVIVVDLGSTVDESRIAALRAADVAIVPVVGELSAIRALTTLFDYLRALRLQLPQPILVLNCPFPKEALEAAAIERAIGLPIGFSLSYDALYLKAINEGKPIVLAAPASQAAERLAALAAAALGVAGPAAAGTLRRRGRLTSLFRRG